MKTDEKLALAIEALEIISLEKSFVESQSTGIRQYFKTYGAETAELALSKINASSDSPTLKARDDHTTHFDSCGCEAKRIEAQTWREAIDYLDTHENSVWTRKLKEEAKRRGHLER